MTKTREQQEDVGCPTPPGIIISAARHAGELAPGDGERRARANSLGSEQERVDLSLYLR